MMTFGGEGQGRMPSYGICTLERTNSFIVGVIAL
ncbi:hypothetical protein CFII64_27423 [Pseudomonas sp. CFII64]|nr:hypothetical protein CFII64_27423 [Pseudomonas sp. CFII64]